MLAKRNCRIAALEMFLTGDSPAQAHLTGLALSRESQNSLRLKYSNALHVQQLGGDKWDALLLSWTSEQSVNKAKVPMAPLHIPASSESSPSSPPPVTTLSLLHCPLLNLTHLSISFCSVLNRLTFTRHYSPVPDSLIFL